MPWIYMLNLGYSTDIPQAVSSGPGISQDSGQEYPILILPEQVYIPYPFRYIPGIQVSIIEYPRDNSA